jgi:hypothetical protein
MISLSVLVIFRDEGAGVCSHLQPPSRRLENYLRSRLESLHCLYHPHISHWHRYQIQECCVTMYLYKTLLSPIKTLGIQDGRRSEALLAAPKDRSFEAPPRPSFTADHSFFGKP